MYNKFKQDNRSKGYPFRNHESDVSAQMIEKPYSTLNSLKSLAVAIEPNVIASEAPVPYRPISKSNIVTDMKYPGKLNTSGNVLDQIPSSSVTSFNKCFDLGHIELSLKYHYLAIDGNDKNKAANIQFGKSTAEAMARVQAETYTDLPFFKQVYETYMPETDSKNYTAFAVWYQTMLQNIAIIPMTYKRLLELEGTLLMMGYNRESPIIAELFGLLKKSSLKAQFNSLSNYIKSQYFDRLWFEQFNSIANFPSRKSNSMRDPLLCVTATMQIPSITAYLEGYDPENPDPDKKIFSDTDYMVEIKPAEGGQPAVKMAFQDYVNELCSILSPYEIVKWSRNVMNGVFGVDTPRTIQEYFNSITDHLAKISKTMTRFPKDVADFVTVMDVANRSGLNRWEKGLLFTVDQVKPFTLTFHKLIHDIYTNYMATSFKIKWDDRTQRWTFFTPWDDFLGTPEYDRFNGGSFITFSCHDIDLSGSDDGTQSKYLVPILFNIDTNSSIVPITFTNREGYEVEVQRTEMEPGNSKALARTNLLENDDLGKITLPYINFASYDATQNGEVSQALYTLENIFNYGLITDAVDPDDVEFPDDVIAECVSTSLVGFVDVQLTDVTNDMINYYQTYAPWTVYSGTSARTMGFIDKPKVVPPVK